MTARHTLRLWRRDNSELEPPEAHADIPACFHYIAVVICLACIRHKSKYAVICRATAMEIEAAHAVREQRQAPEHRGVTYSGLREAARRAFDAISLYSYSQIPVEPTARRAQIADPMGTEHWHWS